MGSFNVYSYETIRGVLEAGAQLRQPVIVAFGERYLANMDFATVGAVTRSVAASLDVEYALHLDHCKNLDNVYRAMAAGFTSVMYDGSGLVFEDNLANTARVVAVAHALGISVEAELGSLAAGSDSEETGGTSGADQVYTDPGQARQFVAETSVDALAVSIGTVHGRYTGEPNIRVDLLRAIRAEVDVPLVLHGGSGTPEAVIVDCVEHGIRKINVNTEISISAANRLGAFMAATPSAHLSTLSSRLVEYVRESVCDYIRLFGRETSS